MNNVFISHEQPWLNIPALHNVYVCHVATNNLQTTALTDSKIQNSHWFGFLANCPLLCTAKLRPQFSQEIQMATVTLAQRHGSLICQWGIHRGLFYTGMINKQFLWTSFSAKFHARFYNSLLVWSCALNSTSDQHCSYNFATTLTFAYFDSHTKFVILAYIHNSSSRMHQIPLCLAQFVSTWLLWTV